MCDLSFKHKESGYETTPFTVCCMQQIIMRSFQQRASMQDYFIDCCTGKCTQS